MFLLENLSNNSNNRDKDFMNLNEVYSIVGDSVEELSNEMNGMSFEDGRVYFQNEIIVCVEIEEIFIDLAQRGYCDDRETCCINIIKPGICRNASNSDISNNILTSLRTNHRLMDNDAELWKNMIKGILRTVVLK